MKTAFVTGGCKGIGLAIAKKLKSLGYNTAVGYFSDDKNAKKVESEFGLFTVKCDVKNKQSMCDAISSIHKKFGDITLLVNSAGVCLKQKCVLDVTEEEFDFVIDTNLKGVFLTTNCVLPDMIKNNNGLIINISSIWGVVGGSCETVYSASKGGIISYTKALNKEVCSSNIRVNCIAPGLIDTDMNSHLSKGDIADFCDNLCVKRIGTPEDVAKCVEFFIQNDYVTGQVINIDGGMI